MEQNLSRRRFLKGAAATLAVPTILRSWSPGRAAPSERINVGMVGINWIGGDHLNRLLDNKEVQIVAVCDVDSGNRERAKKKTEEKYAADTASGTYKGCAAYNDFREFLQNPSIDAVFIAVPDHWHAILAIESAKAGKDIYCEKPMSLTIKEAQAMVHAARRYDRVFQTGSQQRSSGEFLKACELVRNGRIGQIKSVHVNVGGPSGDCYLPAEAVPAGLDWEMWLGPAPWRGFNKAIHPVNWRSFRDYSGGGMTDWGAHHFDIAQWGLGMDESGPVEILPPDGKEVKMLTYRYANGIPMYHDGSVNGVLFVGTEGKVEVNRGYLKTWPESLKESNFGPNDVRLYQSPGHHADFFRCMKTRQRPICDVAIGASSVTVCHLGNIAYLLKRPLRWDPAKQEFVGDEEANRMRDRPRRGPWQL